MNRGRPPAQTLTLLFDKFFNLSFLYMWPHFMSYPRDGMFSPASVCICTQKGCHTHTKCWLELLLPDSCRSPNPLFLAIHWAAHPALYLSTICWIISHISNHHTDALCNESTSWTQCFSMILLIITVYIKFQTRFFRRQHMTVWSHDALTTTKIEPENMQ